MDFEATPIHPQAHQQDFVARAALSLGNTVDELVPLVYQCAEQLSELRAQCEALTKRVQALEETRTTQKNENKPVK